MTGRTQRLFLTLAAFFGLCFSVFAEVTLTAEVSPPTAISGDTVNYTVTVSGDLNEVTHPLINLPEAFKKMSRDPQINQRVSIVNGKYSRNVDFQYQIQCLKPGRFVIPPASLQADGQNYDSNPATVSVLAAGSDSARQRHAASGRGGIKLTATVKPQKAYVGQAVSISIHLYIPRSVIYNGQWGWVEKPSGTGFLPEAIDAEPSDWKLTTVSGVPTMVCELGNYVVTPTKPGEYEFHPGIAMALVKDNTPRSNRRRSLMDSFFNDDFFGRSLSKKVKVAGLPVSFHVDPLPVKDGVTKDTLCVSHLQASSKVTRNRLNENESLTYELRFEGNGDLRSLEAPKLDIRQDFRVFESKSQNKIEIGANGIHSTKIFEYVLVPTRSGTLTLPKVEMSCFDPVEGRLSTAVAPQITLEVTPGEKEENIQVVTHLPQQQAVKIVGKDIRYISESRQNARPISERPFHRKYSFWIVILMAVFVSLLDYYYAHRKELTPSERLAIRASSAKKKAVGCMRKLRSEFTDKKKYYSALRAVMIGYIADKLGSAPSGTVFAEVRDQIVHKGVPVELVDKFDEHLEVCSSAAFSPLDVTSLQMEQEARELEKLLGDIDGSWL